MPIARLCLVSLTLGSLAIGPRYAPADEPKPAAATAAAADGNSEARARLDALIAAYRALPAYADQGEVSLVVKVGDRSLKRVQKASIAFTRPNKLDVRTELVRVVADGSNLTAVVAPLRKYQVSPAPAKLLESSLRGGPLGSIEFGGLTGLPLVHVLNLVIGDEPRRLIEDFTPKILVEPDQEIGGVAYKVLRLDESDNHDWRFLIDPKSGLLSYVDLVIEGEAARSSVAGAATHIESLRWSSGPVATAPSPEATFAYQPEAGFTRVGKLEGAAEGHPEAEKPPVNERPRSTPAGDR